MFCLILATIVGFALGWYIGGKSQLIVEKYLKFTSGSKTLIEEIFGKK